MQTGDRTANFRYIEKVTFTVVYPHRSWEIIRRISSGDLELISVLTRSLFGLHFWFCGLVAGANLILVLWSGSS